jgi:type II secretory pathway component GspD/PulD (secretin)
VAKHIRLIWVMLAVPLVLLALPQAGQAIVYCNITEVKAEQLSNGVQITVKADGLLLQDWYGNRGNANRVEVTFGNARNATGQNFIDVSQFPVSHIELSTPEGAKEGVGVKLAVVLYEPSGISMNQGADQQSFIITVSSTRTLEGQQKGKAAEQAKQQETDLEVTVAGDKVSVTAVKVDIQKLLGEIAAKTGANIAVDDAVQAEANLHLAGLTAAELLRAVATAYGLALTEQDGVYMFSRGVPQDLAAYRLSGTSSFRMRYTRAQAASGLLPTFLYSYLHVNDSQNAVVVTAPQQMLDKIDRDLKAVDIAPPQILIEAIACEFTDTKDLEKLLQAFRGDVTGKTDVDYGLPTYTGTLNTGSGEVSYANIGHLPNDFEARVLALETQQKAHVRAAPRMAVMNGQSADLFIGVRRFIKVEQINYGQVTEKIQGVDVGVKLQVTPLTGGGGEITLRINPGAQGLEVSNISELDPRTGLPVLSTRQAGTTVRVKDGETVAFGGLTQNQTEDRISKIPVLGDLPLLGRLFRSRSRNTVTSELMVFITPHILTPEGRLANTAEEQQLRQRLEVPDAAR